MHTPLLRHAARAMMLLLLVLTGCRTYGGYGTEDATYAEIVKATALFEEELARAQSDLTVLEALSSEVPALVPVAVEYAATLEIHRLVLADNLLQIAELEDGASYRRLNRALGAITAEHERVRDRYTVLLRDVYLEEGAITDQALFFPSSRYVFVPPFYEQIRQANVRAALERAMQGDDLLAPGPRLDSTPSAPADTTNQAAPADQTAPTDSL